MEPPQSSMSSCYASRRRSRRLQAAAGLGPRLLPQHMWADRQAVGCEASVLKPMSLKAREFHGL